jgi:hypothetical protein
MMAMLALLFLILWSSICAFSLTSNTMPSKHMRILQEYEKVLTTHLENRILQEAVWIEDETKDYIDTIVDKRYKDLSSQWYLFCSGHYWKANYAAFLSMMSHYKPDNRNGSESSTGILSNATDRTLPWLIKDEFLNEFCMTPKQFWTIVDSIKNDCVFKRETKRKQPPVELQLSSRGWFLQSKWLHF